MYCSGDRFLKGFCNYMYCLCLFVLQKSRTDASNFDRQFTAEQPTLTPVDSAVVDNITQEEFCGFSFVNDDFGKCSASVCAGDAQSTDNVNGSSVRESAT